MDPSYSTQRPSSSSSSSSSALPMTNSDYADRIRSILQRQYDSSYTMSAAEREQFQKFKSQKVIRTMIGLAIGIGIGASLSSISVKQRQQSLTAWRWRFAALSGPPVILCGFSGFVSANMLNVNAYINMPEEKSQIGCDLRAVMNEYRQQNGIPLLKTPVSSDGNEIGSSASNNNGWDDKPLSSTSNPIPVQSVWQENDTNTNFTETSSPPLSPIHQSPNGHDTSYNWDTPPIHQSHNDHEIAYNGDTSTKQEKYVTFEELRSRSHKSGATPHSQDQNYEQSHRNRVNKYGDLIESQGHDLRNEI